MKTFTLKADQITRKWHLIDARDQILGRLSTRVATLLMGKHKPQFVRHLDIGDHVVVINAASVKVTGRKEKQTLYHRHSGYPGGMVVTTLAQLRQRFPDRIITHAVAGMLPDNKLKARQLKHLHVYPDARHPYTKQFKSL